MHTISSLFKNVALYESIKDQNIMHHVSTIFLNDFHHFLKC